MELEVTRRDFLRAAGLALAGTVASAASAQEQERAKAKEGDKKAEATKKEPPPKAKTASKDDDADWDAAWKSSGSEETRTCPQCGATMYRQGRTWTCNNCGYSYVE